MVRSLSTIPRMSYCRKIPAETAIMPPKVRVILSAAKEKVSPRRLNYRGETFSFATLRMTKLRMTTLAGWCSRSRHVLRHRDPARSRPTHQRIGHQADEQRQDYRGDK